MMKTKTINSFFGGYRFLSNFYPCWVEFEDVIYLSVEHAYQAAKCSDPNYRTTIRQADTARVAKWLGKMVLIRQDWEKVKLKIMKQLLIKKFTDHVLCQMLRNTGDAELVEVNNWGDTFWGVCRGVGENHLGKLLMEIRSTLENEEKTSESIKSKKV